MYWALNTAVQLFMCVDKVCYCLSRQKSRYGAKLEHSDAKLVSGSSEGDCVRVTVCDSSEGDCVCVLRCLL